MSFNSTNRIPYLRDYAEAKHHHDRVKPIRGHTPELRPLAARRDKQMSIRENAEGHIECVLYETPVVTFRQDGVVTVTPGKWPSAYTSSFIENVLPTVRVNRTRDILIVRLGVKKYPLKQGMKLDLKRAEAPYPVKWDVVEAEGVKAWSPNRAKANNVRSAYKGILAYHKNIIALLSQEADKEDNHYGEVDPDEPFVTKKVIVLDMEALKLALGTRRVTDSTWGATPNGGIVTTHNEVEVLDTELFTKIVRKPTWAGNGHDRVAKWMEHRNDLLALMRDDQPEETKHANFMKVSMGLLVNRTGYLPLHPRHNMRSEFRLARSTALEVVNDFLTLAHAEDMMEYKQLPVGRVPTTNYGGMLFDAFRTEGEKA